jgi:hypothetical protein
LKRLRQMRARLTLVPARDVTARLLLQSAAAALIPILLRLIKRMLAALLTTGTASRSATW